MEQTSNSRKSIGMIVASMLIYGSIGIFRRWIPFPSAFIACFRGIIGGLFILIFMLLRRKREKERLPSHVVLWLVISGAVIGINWMLLFEAYNYTTVPTATLCYYMEPTIVVLLSPLLFQEKLTAKKAICSAVAIAGMVLVSGVLDDGKTAGNSYGILLGLGAAVLYAAVVIMNKRLRGIDAYKKTAIQLLAAGLVMIPYLLFTGEYRPQSCGTVPVLLLIALAIIHTGIAYLLYFGSIDGLKAQSIAILSYIDPVSALFFSAVFLKESLNAAGILGAAMILGAALFSEVEFKKAG